MKRVLFIFAILGLTTMVTFGQHIESFRAVGREVPRINVEDRQVSGFTGINASSVFNITVQRGNMESLVIEADASVMPYVRSEVRNGVLYLSLSREFQDIETLNATVVMPNLENVELSGASRLVARDLFTPDRFMFTGNGSNFLDINLNANTLLINVGGISTIELNANVSEYARFSINGVANISGNLITERVFFHYNGVGNVTLTGSATYGRINALGVPTINLVDFPIREATVLAPGVANITVNATHTLSINASGVSTVRYTGAATVTERNASRMSRISRL